MKRRILALLLTLLMLISAFPLTLFTAFAEEASTETTLEEGDVVTLYDNEFDTAMNPNGGSSSSCVREDYTNFNDGKGMTIYGSGTWTEPVPLNNNSGEIVITMYFYNNNFVSGTTLSINDVAIFGGDASAIPTIGGATQGTNARAYRLGTLTVTISDLTTGVASVKYVDQYTNTYTGTVTVGTIKDSITLKMGSFVNSFKVDYVTVTQVYAEEEEVSGYTVNFKSNGTLVSSVSTEGSVVMPAAPANLGYDFMGWSDGENTYTVGAELTVDKDTTFEALWTLSDGVLYGNDFSTTANGADSSGSGASVANGMLVLNGWSNNSWTKNITPNNLKNTITVSFKMQPNLQNSYDILAVNGKVVLKAAANGIVIGDTAYSAVPGYNQSNVVRKVTVTIDPTTNEATVSYNHPTDATHAENYTETVNIGVIVGDLAITLGAVSGANSWSVDDLLVTQQAVAEHTCNFVRSELYSTAATCNVPAMDVGECTVCGATSSRSVVAPALGHDWTEWTVEDGYQTRHCETCEFTETKKVGKIINTMPLLALGDSITFGTGVNNNPQNSWARYVADELELDYVNIAVAGKSLYEWYSTLTGGKAPNGQYYWVGAWTSETLTAQIKKASIIVFTPYTNDMFFGSYRPADKIAQCLVDFVDVIHEINPNAIIVPVGYAYGEAFWPGNQYAQYEEKIATVNELCVEAFNTETYQDYVYYVDCTDIFSDANSFIRDNGTSDQVHPGTQGNIDMAASVMSALGYTTTGDPDTLYTVTIKDGEETVKTDSYYGMYLLPEALKQEGKVFGGWTDGTSVFVENTEVLVIGDTTFSAVWNDPAQTSFNISEIMGTVEGAFVSGDLNKSQVYDSATGILTATRAGRYSFSLQKDVVYDGKTTLALRSTNTYTNTGSSNSDGIGITLPTNNPVLVKNGRYVALTYYYAPVSNTTNVGRPMDLYVTTSSNTFSARSINTTVANGWATVYFDLATGTNVADLAEETITSVALRWYNGTFVSTLNDAYYFEGISFTNVSPFNTVKYQDNGINLTDPVNALDQVTLPSFTKDGYKLVGWTDGVNTYKLGETVTLVGDTTFTAIWQVKQAVTTINYSDELSSAANLLRDYYRNLTTSYDEATGIASLVRSGAYEIQAKLDVLKDGKNTIEVKSISSAGGWNGPALTINQSTGLTLGESRYVTVQYYYDGTALAGQTMTLYVKVGNVFVYAISEDTIVSKEWATVTFDMSTHASFETYKDVLVEEIDLYFYKTDRTESARAYSTSYGFSANNTFNFGAFSYSEEATEVGISATFYDEAQENVIAELTSKSGVFTAPECDVLKDGYVFAGWKAVGDDSDKVYLAGESITLTQSTSFVAVYEKTVNYTATFVTPGETIAPITTQTGYITLPTPADRGKGYVFLGWSDGKNLYAAGQTVLLVADTEFVASWHVEEEHSYTNLQNTLYKLENDKELTVGWITDSIGWGQNGNGSGVVNGVNYGSAFGGGSKNPMSFTRIVTDWLEWYAKENYDVDGADVDVFYSTYGGATHQRELGYLRNDLLAYCPDIVFIETWNGTNVDSDSAYDARTASKIYMESIVQQIYAINPYCDIVLVNPGGNGAGYAFSAIRDQYNLIEIDVASATSAYFSNKEIFGDETANASIYYGGGIHINEEAYAFYSQLITAKLEEQLEAVNASELNKYVPTQPSSMRITTDGEGNAVLPVDTLYSADMLYLTSGRVDADELTYDASWTLTDGAIDVTAPLDSAEKTGAKKLTATADGATVTYTLNGSGFIINGSGSYTVSIDGVEKGTYSGETTYIKAFADDSDGTYEITITAANGASISELYVYAHAYTPIETYENVKDRFVVSYYGRIADEYIHDQQKNGYDILPKYLTWIQQKRDELFGTDATTTIPGGSILASKIEKNGAFVGWVEADSYYFFEGEKFPVINAYKYEGGKIIDLTTSQEKTLYLEGDIITPARDMTLVAVYTGGYDGDETKHVVNFISDGVTLKTVNTTAQITMIAAPVKAGYIFRGWSDGQGNTFTVGQIIRVVGDTTFTAVWEEFTYSEDGSLALNISDDLIFGSVESHLTGNTKTYDAENNVVTAGCWSGTQHRYTYTLSRNVSKGGINTIALGNVFYGLTGSQGDYIALPGVSVQIKDTPYICLTYFYELAGRNTQVGAYMTLGIKTSSGSTFYVRADETIIANEWQTLVFCLEDAHVYKNVAYDVSANAEETISEIYIYWYDFNGREGGFKETAGNTYYFGDIRFSKVSPIFTASFKDGDETVLADIDTKGSIVLPDAVTKAGYNFKGWENGDTVYQPGDTVFLSADATFVAVWEEYKMTFLDGTTVLETIYTTGTFTAPECPISKLNNTFAGWTDGEAIYQPGDTVTVTGDTTFTAVWEGNFTATFVDGDTTVETLENVTNIFIPELAELSKDGYVLGGWTVDGDDTVYTAGDEIVLAGDTTFRAVWIKLHTVTVKDGETVLSTGTTTDEYTLPATVDKEHYTLIGWSDGTTTYAPGKTVTITADTTFVAVWKTAQYTVTFKNGETTVYTTIVTVADSITVPAAYVKEGYVFKGWSDGTTTFAASSTLSVVGDTTFEAEFITVAENDAKIDKNLSSDIAPETLGTANMPWGNATYNEETNSVTAAHTGGRYTYTISHDVKDGVSAIKLVNDSFDRTGNEGASVGFDIPFDIKVADAKIITLDYYYAPTQNYNQVGQKMALILFTESGKIMFVHSNETIVRDQWNTLTFDLANAKVGNSSKMIDFDYTTVSDEKITSMRIRWYQSTDRTDAGGFKARAGDTFWYADMSFAQIGEAGKHTVTLMNGESKLAAAETNGALVLPEVPEGAVGWGLGNTIYSAGDTVNVTEDTTIVVAWNEIFSVTVLDGETIVDEATSTGTYVLPAIPNKNNYTFVGWSDGVSTYLAGETVTITDDTVFNAVWKLTEYTLIFKKGEDVVATLTATVEDSITAPAAYVKEGYVFKGWSDGTTTFAASSMLSVVGDTTFEASYVTAEENAGVRYNISNDLITTTNGALKGYSTYTYDEANDTYSADASGRYSNMLSRDVLFDGKTAIALETLSFSNGSGWQNSYIAIDPDITVGEISRISIDYYYAPTSNYNNVGRNMVIRITANGKTLYVYSNETIVKDTWATITFDLANACVPNSSNSFDLSSVKDSDITLLELWWYDTNCQIGQKGNFRAKAGDVYYYTDILFSSDTSACAYTATFMYGDEVYAEAETYAQVVLPTFEGLTGWSDGETTYNGGETVTLVGDTTFTAEFFAPDIAHSVSFHNNLTLNYYVDAAALEGYENIRLVIEKDEYKGGEKTTSEVTLRGTLTDDGYKFVYTGIAAVEVGDELRATVYADKNGETYVSEQDVYSVKTYAYNLLAASTTKESFKTLLVDMLNYCAASQIYFGYRTDELVNADLTAEQRAYGTQTDATVSSTIGKTTLEGATANVYAISALFNSNVELKFYLDLSAYDDISNISFKIVYGENVTTITSDKFSYDEGTGCYTVKYKELPASELRGLIDVTIVCGDEAISDTITYSIESYVNSRLQNSTNEEFKTLLRELMKYSDSARNYFR